MKVLVEGKAHKKDVFYCNCRFCESEIRIMKGDPRSYVQWSGQSGVEYVMRFVCPVCDQLVQNNTYHDHEKDEMRVVEDEVISKEDKDEMKEWYDDDLSDLDDEELTWVHGWERKLDIKTQ